MRILFAGSPAIAIPSLKILSKLESEKKGIELAGILTNPDSRRGRHGETVPTDLSSAASEMDLIRKESGLAPIVQLKPEKLDAGARAEVAALVPDLLVSFAFGRLFGPRFLELFRSGGINIHPSLLPKYRGASPIPAVIFNRETETGICIQKLAPVMDTGDILAVDRFALSGRETALSLSETAAERAALLLSGLLAAFDAKTAGAQKQTGEPSYCKEIKKEEGLIDWKKSACEIDAHIRAYTPWPLSFTRLGNEVLFILEAKVLDASCTDSAVFDASGKTASVSSPGTVLGMGKEGVLIQTGKGVLSVSRLQWQTKKALDWKSFCNGRRNFIGSFLGASYDAALSSTN